MSLAAPHQTDSACQAFSLNVAGIASSWHFEPSLPAEAHSTLCQFYRQFAIPAPPDQLSVEVSLLAPGKPLLPRGDPRILALQELLVERAGRFPVDTEQLARVPEELERVRQVLLEPPAVEVLEYALADPETVVLHPLGRESLFVVSPGSSRAWLLCREDRLRIQVQHIQSAMYVLYALVLPRFEGLLLHAAALRGPHGARVFVGHGGAGKTTVARRFQQHGVLADDGAAICRSWGGWQVWPTPWQHHRWCGADMRGQGLDQIVLLEQADRTAFLPMPQEQAMGLLLNHHLHCLRYLALAELEQTFGLVERLLADHPCQRMQFDLTGDLWNQMTDQSNREDQRHVDG